MPWTLDPALRAPVLVSLGAIAGALSRYYLSGFVAVWLGTDFPYGTLLINVSGSFVMGVFSTWSLEKALHLPELRLLVAVGFLGSFTTFSSYALEVAGLNRSGQWGLGLLYALGSVALGCTCLELGSYLARRLM